jgi:hypothetical protein
MNVCNVNSQGNNNNNEENNESNEENNSDKEKMPIELEKRRSKGEEYESVNILEDNANPLLIQKQGTTRVATLDNKSKLSFLFFYEKINVNLLRVISLIVILLYMASGLTGGIFFGRNRDTRPFLFCFNFLSRDATDNDIKTLYERIIFSSDLNSFCIIMVIEFFLLIILMFTLILNRNNDGKNFIKNFSIFFPLSLLFNIPVFVVGLLSAKNDEKYWNSIIYIICTLLSTLCLLKIYISSKKVKYKNITRVITQGFISGLLSAFELYTLMYNICYISTRYSENNVVNLEIIPGVIYFIFSFLTVILYNDVFFSCTALLIQVGLLYIKKSGALAVVIFNIGVVIFGFVSIIIVIMKHKKKVFHIVIEGENKNDDNKKDKKNKKKKK